MFREDNSERNARRLLAVGFTLVIVLLLADGFIGFRGLRSIRTAASELADDQFTQMTLVDEVQREQGSLSAIYYLLEGDPDSLDRERIISQVQTADNNLRQIVGRVPLRSPDRETWEHLQTASAQFSAEARRLVALKNPPTRQSRELLRMHADVLATVSKLIGLTQAKSRAAKDRIERLAAAQIRQDAFLLGTSVFLAIVCVVFVLRTTARLNKKMMEQSGQLARVSWHLLENQEMVARRLSHELHDELGQALTALKMNFAMHADSQCVNPAWMRDCSNLLKESIRSTHEISQLLRPTILDDFGLVAALNWLCERLEERSGIGVDCYPEFQGRLSAETETHLFRIAQEALTNAARHSGASRVIVRLYQKAGDVHLSITDDGKGLPDPEDIRKGAFGLTGIRARTQSSNGALIIRSRPGQGTAVEVRVPWEVKMDEEKDPHPVG
jgi:signal transduction histidine kinase